MGVLEGSGFHINLDSDKEVDVGGPGGGIFFENGNLRVSDFKKTNNGVFLSGFFDNSVGFTIVGLDTNGIKTENNPSIYIETKKDNPPKTKVTNKDWKHKSIENQI